MSQIEVPLIEYVSPADLKVDNQNPNRMTPKQLEALRACIQKYGFIVPIVTNKDLLIADGEQRWTIAKELQMQKVPVVRLPIKDVDRRTLRQVLNKLRGKHAYSDDVEEFVRIVEQDGKNNLKVLLQNSDDNFARFLRVNDAPSLIEEAPKNLGKIAENEVIEFNGNSLTCGDAFKIDWSRHDAKLVFMDPPWNLPIPHEFIKMFIDMGAQVILLHNDRTAVKTAFAFKEHFRYCLIFTRSTATISVSHMPLQHHTVGIVLAKKPKFNKLTPPVTTVFTDYSSPFRHDKNPLVTKTIIEAYTDEGDMVLEPFANKPTMLYVCENLKRKYHGAEIDGNKCAEFKWQWENKHLCKARVTFSTAPDPALTALPNIAP